MERISSSRISVDNTPRSIPRFLVPLVHQTPRGGNSRVRGQVDIPGEARHIQAIQLDRVNQVFQRARISQVANPHRAASDLVLVGRADAAPGGAEPLVTAAFLAGALQSAVRRQDQCRIVGQF